MITIEKIVDSINILLLSSFPQHTYYIEEIPSGFKRPSFYIQLITDSWTDSNRATTIENPSFQIVYFGSVDNYQHTPVSEKLSVYQSVKDLFKCGYLNVNGEAVKLAAKGFNGEIRDNEVYFTLELEYFALRVSGGEEYPAARDLYINIRED
ncbi:MAG TPA: hypothetical protein VHP38_17060 [Ruminiclostridium sp.]|nr:hypothetical protein [Ruminiclostridium sp.]